MLKEDLVDAGKGTKYREPEPNRKVPRTTEKDRNRTIRFLFDSRFVGTEFTE
jgi:hypothetical protein